MKNQNAPFKQGALAAAFIALSLLAASCSGPAEDGAIRVSGNIEVDDARLAFKVPGIVVERAVSEGGTVTQGQTVARLDDTEQVQQVEVQRSEVAAAAAALADLEAGSRPQEIDSAKATVESTVAEARRAALEFERQRELRENRTISAREFEVAEAALAVARARAAEASERLKLIIEGPRIETINQARARLEQTRAALALAERRLEFTKLVSPLTGVVLSKNIEPGEYVAPGTAVVTVADTSKVWLRAFVNETDLGKIHLGQEVEVSTDSFPDKTYRGTIAFIASEAEFTPKTVQTNKERVKLVFRVKIDLENDHGELKPGMPADAVIKPRG
ncbi:MAG TPA: efflux RND transporter periplasmic adaptor subunit [Opitutaceae bacterium]